MRCGRRDSLFDQHLTLHEGNAMNRASTLALVLLAFSGAAQPKDLVGVFEDAVHNDPVIRQADANRLAAREARPQALAALLPQLSGTAGISGAHSAGYQDQVFKPPTAERFQITTDTNTRQWAVNLRQNVFSWANWMALKEAGREVAQAEATYQAAEQQLILRVAQAYFNVLAAEDGLEANPARDTAAAAVIAAKRTLATSEDQLQEITGEKYPQLAKPGADMTLKSPEPADESRWVSISLEQNLSLISSRLGAEIARDNVRIAVGGHFPTLDLVAGRSYTQTSASEIINLPPPVPQTSTSTPIDSKLNDRQIALQLTVPLFAGGLTQSKVRQTQYLWIAAREAVVQSSRATERQARDAYLGVISGIARVQALRQALESSQTALKATEAGYEVGTRTAVDVLNSRKTLVQAKTDYSGSRYDYIVSVLQLRLAAGNLDRPQLEQINSWLGVAAPTSPAVATPESLAPSIPPATPPPGGKPGASRL